jgi:hypothetical protein
MKALTLSQPFATLVAIGAKRIETRSWSTNYRGPLAIHAAKTIPREYKSLCNWTVEPFASALKGVLWDCFPVTMNLFGQEGLGTQYQEYRDKLHLGCVIAICELTNCVRVAESHIPIVVPIDDRIDIRFTQQFTSIPPRKPEFDFGNYEPGRYAWILQNIKILKEPFPIKGMLGLWELNNDIEAES